MEYFEKKNMVSKCNLILDDIDITIDIRNDGYIFATGLCKTVGKKLKNWLLLEETTDLISKIEKNETIQLVEKYKKGTWLHPEIGIELVEWCYTGFSLQLSKLIIKIINEENLKMKKQLKEHNLTNKDMEDKIKRIKDLEDKNKILEEELKEKNIIMHRIQKRKHFPDKNVVYIITANELEKDGIYVFGKAVDLTHRLSTYNKSLEHKVIYYKSFKDVNYMKTAEMMFMYKLNKYRDSKKERLILPKDKDISLFTNILDEIYNWFDEDMLKDNINENYHEDDVVNDVVDVVNVVNVVNDVNDVNDVEDVDVEDVDVEDVDVEDVDVEDNKIKKFAKNTVYLLTSEIHLKNRTYIIGKSKNLNSRLTAYNKGLEHIVVHTIQCKNIYQMAHIENMILYKLDKFREKMNRDRFILPFGKDVSFFTDVFDKLINWFGDVDSTLEIIKDENTIKEDRENTKKVYREKHKDVIKENNKIYRKKNRDGLLVKHKNYRETHIEQVSDGKKDWYKRNKDNVIDRVKNNYYDKRDEKIEKVKEYSSKNKEKIKERNAITIICDCGVKLRKYGLGSHIKTTNHISIMKEKENLVSIA